MATTNYRHERQEIKVEVRQEKMLETWSPKTEVLQLLLHLIETCKHPFGIIQKILKWNLIYFSDPRTAVLLDDAALHTSCQGQWGEISSNKEHATVLLPTAWSRFIQLMRTGSMYHISVIRWQSSATYSSETLLFCSSDSLYSLISNQLTLMTVLLSVFPPQQV